MAHQQRCSDHINSFASTEICKIITRSRRYLFRQCVMSNICIIFYFSRSLWCCCWPWLRGSISSPWARAASSGQIGQLLGPGCRVRFCRRLGPPTQAITIQPSLLRFSSACLPPRTMEGPAGGGPTPTVVGVGGCAGSCRLRKGAAGDSLQDCWPSVALIPFSLTALLFMCRFFTVSYVIHLNPFTVH